MNLLIADDNRQITSILTEYAKKEGYTVQVAHDGEQALALFGRQTPDLILLDVMMPKIDGFEVCRRIRKTSGVPILMVTARGEDFERIMGLDTGADDYIVKPFSPGEVMARIRAVLRRVEGAGQDGAKQIRVGGLSLNLETFRAALDGREIPLTKKEMEIAWTLASHPGRVYTRDNLLDLVWGQDYFGDTRTVDTHIKRLRAKLDATPHPGWEITTVWGVGYSFEVCHEDE